MLRAALLIAILLAFSASPALAASGNGLYEPFPSTVKQGVAQAYFAKLGVRLSARALETGRLSGALAQRGANGPSRRAGAGAGGLGAWELLVVAAVALSAAAVAARRARTPAPRTGVS
jgi:hypothetical protein